MLLSTVFMALRELRRNTLRSLLTILGIVVGVAAVVALVTIGDGATAKIRADIASLGDNLVMFGAWGRPLNEADLSAIREEIPGVQRLAPIAEVTMKVVFGSDHWRTYVTGVTPVFLQARSFKLERGHDVERLLDSGEAVCVLGATPARELFGPIDPLGKKLRIGRMSCEIIGVLAAKGAVPLGRDLDDLVLVPLRTFQQRISGRRDVTMVFATARPGRSTAVLKVQLDGLIGERRHLANHIDKDYWVEDVRETVELISRTTGMMTAMLGAVAAVSLLVGGIGIMNIMVVSVTERTREIGTRLAIGALGADVLKQFLIEAVILSLLGGLLGVVVGLLGAVAATQALEFPLHISGTMVLVAFAFSAGVGVTFGYLPARKAARFNPIEALRHE